ncbi:MAG TPA: hypothetical protein PLD20_00990 [Blastocatellia bacterium]|nr:hypothetical protein [Blastocatellia bacterium]HMV81823.1 hypothetical protein [Blastocatellia bacterium]HMX23996.1 hypothetical protein [Blastocatellia bacterium]HMY70426.1 hypothetical protein [Blastocatellia bacterium]HMZ16511.1 hypothetical protein [Blastocatellia bacterium]
MPVGIQQRSYYMSRIPQADYRTKKPFNTSAPYNFVRILVEDKDLANYQPETRDDKGYSTGSYFASDVYLFRHGLSSTKRFDVSSDQIGRWLLPAMGAVATTQPDAGGNPTVYKHVFTPLDPNVTLQPPAYTFGEKLGGGVDHLFPSICVKKLRISGEDVGRVKGEVDLIGSGKRIDPSGAIFSPTASFNIPGFASQVYFAGSQLALRVADETSLANPINYCSNLRVNTWSVEINRTLAEDAGYRQCAGDFQDSADPDSGAVRSELLQTDFDVVINFQVRVESGSAEYTALQTQKKLDWKADLTGKLISGIYNHKLTLNSLFSAYKAVQVGNQDDLAVFNIEVKQLFNSSTGNSFKAELINTTASYVV